MDVRAALSALHDGEPADATCPAALEHRATCPECGGFARALEALAAIPSPSAPRGLAERISMAVSAEAELAQERAAALEAGLVPVPEPAAQAPTAAGTENAATRPVTGLPPWLTRTRLWTATVGVTLAAAAIVVAVVVSGQGVDQAALSKAVQEGIQRDATVAGAGSAAPARPSAPAPSAPVSAPDYVAFETFTYVAGAAFQATGSTLTTVGATQTALRGPTVLTVPVLRAAGSASDIVLAVPASGYQTFSPVTRQLGGRRYRLAAGPSLDRFGVWPALPSGWNQPTTTDGSPYYREAGTDALGVRLFVRIGQTPELGFLVGPGTPATDPAAGDPNWTLWLPVQ